MADHPREAQTGRPNVDAEIRSFLKLHEADWCKGECHACDVLRAAAAELQALRECAELFNEQLQRVLTLDQVFAEDSPYEYDQGDFVIVWYDELYKLRAEVEALRKERDRVEREFQTCDRANQRLHQRVHEEMTRAEQAEAGRDALSKDYANLLKESNAFEAERDKLKAELADIHRLHSKELEHE